MKRLKTRLLLLPGLVLALAALAATSYFAFPQYILQAMTASSRYSAGLERKSVAAAGHTIAYLEGGAGPTVVLLHGFGATKDLWDGVAAQLTPGYRVIIPDIPGFGESAAMAGERYDAPSQAARLRAFLDVVGIGRHHIGGNSMGGMIAAAYAASYPDSVLSLLLSASPGVRGTVDAEIVQLVEEEKNPLVVSNEADLDLLLRLAYYRPPALPGQFKRIMVEDARERAATYLMIFEDLQLGNTGAAPLASLLPKISSPTLITWGAHDRMVHPSVANTFAAGIPGAEITIFEDCGHALPRECPQELGRRYVDFLDSPSVAAGPGGVAPGHPTAAPGIAWYTGSIEQAFAAAASSAKPILLYWGAEWCPPCHKLKSTIFQRDEFIEQSRRFIPVYLDGDTERAQKYGEQFGVAGYPTVIIFDPQGAEITRIPGGIDIEQYLGVLELALNALRPVTELLQAVDSGQSISADDWRLLAAYSWEQDRGRVLGERDLHITLRNLALACPDGLPAAKSRLQMLALAEWAGDENRDISLAAGYARDIAAVLADAELRRHNRSVLIAGGGTIVAALSDPTRDAGLDASMTATMLEVITDSREDVLTRINGIYGWVDVQLAGMGEEETLSGEQQAWVKTRVETAWSQVDRYQRHAALNAIAQIYLSAGLDPEARAALAEGLEVSDQPYYFMSGMAFVEQEAGNNAAALAWHRKAWEASRGAATQVQWGSDYLLALIELKPNDLGEIEATGAAIFAQLASQADGLRHRSRARMDRLSAALLAWAKPAAGATTNAAQRAAVLGVLRRKMDALCAAVEEGTEAAGTCAEFLVEPIIAWRDAALYSDVIPYAINTFPGPPNQVGSWPKVV